jgi:Zinc-binding loop region of homing endonuclease
MSGARYNSLYERLVANTVVNERGCWIWTGVLRNGYPTFNVRADGAFKQLKATRAMLEITTKWLFPFDEAGHLCNETRCINPEHLEIQTASFNASERSWCKVPRGCCIPVLFPTQERLLEELIEKIWNSKKRPSKRCPF